MSVRIFKLLFTTSTLASLMACGGSSGDGGSSTSTGATSISTASNSTSSVAQSNLPAGDIRFFGTVSVADEGGEASDLLGGFFELDAGVDTEYFDTLMAPNSVNCTVEADDDSIDFEEISVSYIPSLIGATKTSIGAGETIQVSANGSSYAELTQQPIGGFVFYDVSGSMVEGEVPSGLLVDIPGDEFSAFSSLAVPQVSQLEGFSISTGDRISPSSVFSWDAGSDSTAQVRIFTSTAGGFFREDSVSISCIVPDNGQFSFPSSVTRQLDSDFEGGQPIVSRIQTNATSTADTVLFVIRETFFDF